MTLDTYIPIIKQAARAYFREDDAPLGWLNSAQHRAFVNAVHEAFGKIESERERNFIEAVYKDTAADFAEVVDRVAYSQRFGRKRGWETIRAFVDAAAKCVILK